MSSIQILEIPPVEAQIQDLSYDMTGSIVGGQVIEPTLIDCVSDLLGDLGRELGDADADPYKILTIISDYLACVSLLGSGSGGTA